MATDLTALTSKLKLAVTVEAAKAQDQSTPQDSRTINVNRSTSFGTGANKADQYWGDIRLIAASGSDELDLAGVLTNAFGTAITFAKIKMILIINRSDETLSTPSHNASNQIISISPSDSNGFTGPFADVSDQLNYNPQGVFLAADFKTGWTVTAGTGDKITISNAAGGEAAYEILIIGESA